MINFDIQRTNCVIFVKTYTSLGMKFFKNIIVSAVFAISLVPLAAQEKIGSVLEVDKMVHNFGEIMHKSGPVSCL